MVRCLMMAEERREVTERILRLTLEIIYLLTGEEYTAAKKTSDCGNLSGRDKVSGGRSQDLIPEPHEGSNRHKILQLTNEIIEVLTGEGEDLTDVKVEVMEEDDETYARRGEPWKEEGLPPEIGADGPRQIRTSNRSAGLYPSDPEEDKHAAAHQVEGLATCKVEAIQSEAEPHVRLGQQCKEEEAPAAVSPGK
ncbi:gastrula zinc finger protein XlCGF66.1-like isoform X2 [Eleutherodactylus coqui]|uniref:gastrula zinc finger protein XlCGF66.1-like isoform X2 n=1 Tax=Eleutherodactylus coqui TaxID=57060 RepID=UPI0034633E40